MMTPELMKRISEAHSPSLEVYWKKERDIVVCSQNPNGTSVWAEWVRYGLLGHSDVVWVFEQVQGRRRWLFLSLDTGRDRAIIFDLRHKEGRDDLKRMEERMGVFFSKQMKEAEEDVFSANYVEEDIEKSIQEELRNPRTWDNFENPGWPRMEI